MKKIYNYTFQLVYVCILMLSCFSVSNFEMVDYNNNIYNENHDKVLTSVLLVNNQISDTLKEKEDSINQEKNKISMQQEIVNIIDTSSYPVLSQETVNLSHYGHDCYGCTSGYTASGYYVGDGRIYYQDQTFGSVRVVAADNKYPLGTILRIDYNGNSITAIVLDRGGGIGDENKFQIDLLTTSNNHAYELGTIYNTNLEVLRLGY